MNLCCCQEQICAMKLAKGNMLRHYGRFLLDGDVGVRSDQDEEKDIKNVFAFLFEKILILTKPSKLGKNGMFEFENAFLLSDYSVQINHGKNAMIHENRFTLVLRCKKQFLVCTLYFKNGTLRNKWLNTLQNAK